MNEAHQKYDRLDETSQRLLLILALQHDRASYSQLTKQAEQFGLRQGNGRALTQTIVRDSLKKWSSSGLLLRSSDRPAPELMDRLVREALSGPDAQRHLSLARPKDSWGRRDALLDFYVAFYAHDAHAWDAARRQIADGVLPLLVPFCPKTFAQLPLELQHGFFTFTIPSWIAQTEFEPEAQLALGRLLDDGADLPSALLPRLLEWSVASGDRGLLERISVQTAGKMRDVEGCSLLLQGDFDGAFSLLAGTLGSRANKQALTRLGGLPSLLATFAGIAGHSSVSREQALKATMAVWKPGATPYDDAFAISQRALFFLGAPANVGKLISDVNATARSPLAQWVAGYLQVWLAGDSDGNAQVSGLTDAATMFRTRGCYWLAAESHAAAGRSRLKTADKQQEHADELHRTRGTTSLIDFVQPEPIWSRTLNALALVGGQTDTTTATPAGAEPTERLIYEIVHNTHDFQLEVYHQVRQASQWSKGRKVALSRLFLKHADAEFAFLTPEDRALCQAMRQWTERSSYGYPEEYTDFETRSGARALVGHPRIFHPKNREQPLEIIEQPISLVVCKHDDSQIELLLEPQPHSNHDVLFKNTGPHQIAITLVEAPHRTLQAMLGKGLRVPISASKKVLETITQLASLVTIHSEIGDLETGEKNPVKLGGKHGQSTPDAGDRDASSITPVKKVNGDPQVHLHLLPSGDGLRAEFYVQPFGKSGPACRPGEGGGTLFATIDGEATSANRDLSLEVQNAQSVIDQCAGLSSHLTESWTATFPTPIEALDLLLDLEPLAISQVVTLHWPKGRSLRLSGLASESMMRVRIRRDRNWFAASGELKLDSKRSIDMLQWIELASASPGRFVKLGDGEFLALTNNLRQRIDDLRLFGDARSAKGKLRFAAVHAGLLEDLGEMQVTSDAHWKKCLQRMRASSEIHFHVPDTLQAELRPYQQEGIAWMQRLAAWGVGGCLADDMGLGKTVQTLGVLLQRAADGPALVIAPTSVIYN